jgi:hypothetical protein
MSQGDTNDNENVIARLVLNEVKELDEAIQRDCFPFASLWALAHIARNDRKRVWLFFKGKKKKSCVHLRPIFRGNDHMPLSHKQSMKK